MDRPRFDEHIVFLPTLDLPRTERFYQEQIGLELVLQQPGCTIFRCAGTAYVGFCQKDAVPSPAESVFLTFTYANLEALHGWLEAQGVGTDGPPRHNPRYAIWQFFARDPNGYTLEFQRFEDENWSSQGSSITTAW